MNTIQEINNAWNAMMAGESPDSAPNRDDLFNRVYAAGVAEPDVCNEFVKVNLSATTSVVICRLDKPRSVLQYKNNFVIPSESIDGAIVDVPQYPFGLDSERYWIITLRGSPVKRTNIFSLYNDHRGLLTYDECCRAATRNRKAMMPVALGIKRGGLTPIGAEATMNDGDEFLAEFRQVLDRIFQFAQ